MTLDELTDPVAWERYRKLGTLPRFIRDMVGCPQEKSHHPEGDVYTHTILVMEQARLLTNDWVIRLAAALHDTGKPKTTTKNGNKIVAYGHEEEGGVIAKGVLYEFGVEYKSIMRVVALVENHMTPHSLFRDKARLSGWRRLALKLGESGENLNSLAILCLADASGRGEVDSGERKAEYDAILGKAKELATKTNT